MIDSKYSEFHDAVYRQDEPDTKSYGIIQWKGTEVCMDVQCECGYHSHIDGEFAYYFRCVGCGKKYAIGPTVRMIPLTDDQADYAETRHTFFEDQ